jgi:hypothetical protein
MNSLSAVTAAVPKQFLSSFTFSPTSQPANAQAKPKRIRSPAGKPKRKPGPRTKPIYVVPTKFLAPRVSPLRQRGSFTTEFKLGVLRWWEHGTVYTPRRGSRQPNRTDVIRRYGIKHENYLNRWLKVQLALASLLMVWCSS